MRSRYAAYVLKKEDYLLATWHSSSRPRSIDLDDDAVTWTGLTVLRRESLGKNRAIVEFSATFEAPGSATTQRLHEISRFVKEGPHWFYVDGDHPQKSSALV